MTIKNITLKEVFAMGFLQGFKSSGEGYNGDYPFDYDETAITNNNSYKLDLDIAYHEYVEKLMEANSQ